MVSLLRTVTRLVVLTLSVVAGSALSAFTPTEDGLYAVFTTNHGTFAARLFFEDAPHTVANFAGLAEGSLHHLDDTTGLVSGEPYYDGIAFHRIIDGFMIQGGSPNGLGTDGPGYTIFDEIRSNHTHQGAGKLSMAKTAAPNSGGSQFFITLGATPWLDGVHTVFGEIVEGMPVVAAIGRVPTDGADRPHAPVVMERVAIVRHGAAAEAFDVRAFSVPEVRPVDLHWQSPGSVFAFERATEAAYRFFGSANLLTWAPHGAAPTGGEPGIATWDATPHIQSGPYFVNASAVHHSAARAIAGRNLVLNVETWEPIRLAFGDGGVGAYTYDSEPGQITGYQSFHLGTTHQIVVEFSGLIPMQLFVQDGDAASGRVFIRAYGTWAGQRDDFNITGTYRWE